MSLLIYTAMYCYAGKTPDDKLSKERAWSEDFQTAEKDGLPVNWQEEGSKIGVPETQCKLVKHSDGTTVLQLKCNKSTGGIIIAPKVNLNKTPIMRWRWRMIHPVVLKDSKEPDDQAASLYVCDGNSFRQFTVSYRWEVLPEIGSTKVFRYGSGALTVYGICLRNRFTTVGEWVEEERDVTADFKKLFKRDLSSRFAIGVGGNSQYSKSNTRVEIDYLEFHPRRKNK